MTVGGTRGDANGAPAHVPRHVGIVMDGNGRWAQQRGLSRSDGHRAGTMRVRPIAEACIDSGVKFLTVYALSTENWSRPLDEIDILLELIGDRFQAERKAIFENRIRIKVLGSMGPSPPPCDFPYARWSAQPPISTGSP